MIEGEPVWDALWPELDVALGDWVLTELGLWGEVVGSGSIKYRKQDVHGYKVRKWNGADEWVPVDMIVLRAIREPNEEQS